MSIINNIRFIMNTDYLIALISFVFLYLTYYFSSDFSIVKRIRFRFNETPESVEQSIYLRRTLGFLLLGVIPFILVLTMFERSLLDYGLGVRLLPGGIWWIIIPTLIIGVGSIFRSNKGIDTTYYPEVRQFKWTKRRTTINALFWAVYLLGYEFAIRGMLFFACFYEWGLVTAIIINSVIYSLIHIFKGRQEAFGAFFLGIILCLIAYYTNSFWVPFIIHVLLAVINDIKAVQASPTMTYDFGSMQNL